MAETLLSHQLRPLAEVAEAVITQVATLAALAADLQAQQQAERGQRDKVLAVAAE